MNNIFVGQFVTEDESLKDKRISQAGNNFQLKLIKMLSPKLSISLYPIFLQSKAENNDTDFITINNQYNLPYGLSKVVRMLKDSIDAFKILRKQKGNIFYYNIDKQNFLLIFFTKLFLSKKNFLILADYPYYENKSFFEKTCNFILKQLDGILVLNSNIIVNSNQKTMPGLVEDKAIIIDRSKIIRKNVLLSGSLGFTTGLHVALETFSKKPEFNLFISGRPYDIEESEFNTLLSTYTKNHSNIKYFGLLSIQEYNELLNDCDIALSLRNPEDVEHQYNFPSKILEYLSKSKIVVSTLQYKDIPSDFLFHCSFNSDSLSSILDEIVMMENEAVFNLKEDIFEYLHNNFTEKKLKELCNELISKC